MSAAPMSQTQAAAVAGVTTRRLRQLEEEGKGPPRSDNGGYPVHEFAAWLRARCKGDPLTMERARLAGARANKAEIDVKDLRGELLEADAVARCWRRKCAEWHPILSHLPDRLALALARLLPTKEDEARNFARAEIEPVLKDMARHGGLPMPTKGRNKR